MNPPSLVLLAEDLCSKWGFGDGDTPEHLMDYWDAVGVRYASIDWTAALVRLVREHLLPALAENHDIDVEEISTIHNPIRARTIDGEEIDTYNGPVPELRPESVTVPYGAIAAACGLTS